MTPSREHLVGILLRRRHLGGFTLVELAIVIAIIVALALASIPGILSITRRAALNSAVMRVQAVIVEAQRLARRTTPAAQVLTAASHYGVTLVTDSGAPYITITYGTGIDDELVDGDGRPASRAVLPASLAVQWSAAAPRLGWFFQYGTGRPLQSPTDQRPVDVGTSAVAARGLDSTGGSNWSVVKLYNPRIPAIPASPVATSLQLRQLGGQAGVAIAVYSNGLVAVADVP